MDLETITDRMAVRQAVQRGDMETAIDRVNDLNPEILEHQRELYFHLQQQRLVEKIRAGETAEALTFAQEYLAPLGEDSPAFLEELERTVALLAFDEDCAGSSPFGDLLSPAQRNKTAGELNAALLASQCQERDSRLPVLLRMLLWAQDRLREHVKFPEMPAQALEQQGRWAHPNGGQAQDKAEAGVPQGASVPQRAGAGRGAPRQQGRGAHIVRRGEGLPFQDP